MFWRLSSAALRRWQICRSRTGRIPRGAKRTVSQVIVALTELGISPDDERFVKNGQTLEQVLLRFAQEDGSFRHIADGKSDEMATEQALYALAAISRAQDGRTTLYDMTDTAQ